jgi:hypothetical protein
VTRRIHTQRLIPILTTPGCEWVAVYDGYQPGQAIGYGATESEAVADLKTLTACDTRYLESRA